MVRTYFYLPLLLLDDQHSEREQSRVLEVLKFHWLDHLSHLRHLNPPYETLAYLARLVNFDHQISLKAQYLYPLNSLDYCD